LGELLTGRHRARPGTGSTLGPRLLGAASGVGSCHHPSSQIDADQLGRWIALSSRAKKPAGAAANVQDPSCLGQEPPTKLQGCLLNGNEQELLEDAVLVGARPEVEPTRGRAWVAHESALVDGGSVDGWRWLPMSRAPVARQSSRWPLSWSRT
jgi:hypothetical protein